MFKTWAGCFLLTVIIFALQLFPVTGIYMMFLAAPFWTMILINLGFGLMARDAWRDPAQRWLMILPLIWFGGYFVVTSVSHWEAHRYEAEIAAANAGRHITFDSARQDLVIEPDRNDEWNGSSLRAPTLVRSFGIIRAYERASNERDGYRNFAIIAGRCPSPTVVKNDDGTTTIYSYVTDAQGRRFSVSHALCFVQASQAPEGPMVRVRPQRQVGRYEDSRVSQDIEVETSDSATTTLRSGWARPLSWLPQPVIGCALDSGTPAWRCFAAFQRQSLYDPSGGSASQSAEKVVAKALGLTRVTVRERYPDAGWT